MNLAKLETLLNSIYKPEEFSDYGPSGLVVEGRHKVTRGATAVSFTLEAIRKAISKKCDFLVVHHGHGFWNNQPRHLRNSFGKKITACMLGRLSVFVYHLPMDMQPEIGNNIQILGALKLTRSGEFGREGGHFIGLVGKAAKPLPFKLFLNRVHRKIGRPNFVFSFGPVRVDDVAVCSGGGANLIREALETGAGTFLTGEAREETYSFCREEGLNFIAAGHYNTEVFGPAALAARLSAQGLPTAFINLPTPV